jgi:hypothetical protein
VTHYNFLQGCVNYGGGGVYSTGPRLKHSYLKVSKKQIFLLFISSCVQKSKKGLFLTPDFIPIFSPFRLTLLSSRQDTFISLSLCYANTETEKNLKKR